jgi:uncharacterized protein
MDWMNVHFSVSGVETWFFLPPLVAFVISFFTSMGGLSGAFLLLPFQMSVLGYTSPSVSGTNHLFNVVAIPSGVYQFTREGRMVWPLTWTVIIGTLPGVFIGAWVRVAYLPDPKNFKIFAGFVLLYIGARLAWDIFRGKNGGALVRKGESADARPCVTGARFSLTCVEYTFAGERHAFSPFRVFVLTFIVGIVGGIYGIGGGAIIAPFFIAIFRMPVYTVAGAALMGTFITSASGVLIYQFLNLFMKTNMSVAPDWALGGLFGIGGFFGVYLGARCQKYVPVKLVKLILSISIFFVAIKYLLESLR